MKLDNNCSIFYAATKKCEKYAAMRTGISTRKMLDYIAKAKLTGTRELDGIKIHRVYLTRRVRMGFTINNLDCVID